MIAIECGVIVVSGAVAAISTHRRVSPAVQGLLLGAAAGALFGVSDIAITYLADAVEDGVLKLISPWTMAAWSPRWVPSMPRPVDCSWGRASK